MSYTIDIGELVVRRPNAGVGVVPQDLHRRVAAEVTRRLGDGDGSAEATDMQLGQLRAEVDVRSTDPARWDRVVDQIATRIIEQVGADQASGTHGGEHP